MLLALLGSLLFQSKSVKSTFVLEDIKLNTFTYRAPTTTSTSPIIFVFHGMLRNAEEYCKDTIPLADKLQATIIAPEFSQKDFPNSRYNRGGILDEKGVENPRAKWTYRYLGLLIQQVRKEQGMDRPVFLIGHSAGGQFLGRMSAFFNSGAQRIVVANPSSWVWPSTDRAFPYGFGGLSKSISDDAALQNYLAQPFTIYLGTKDDHQDGSMDDSKEAMEQGPNRLERGRAVFEKAKSLAKERGWTFNWILVEAPGVDHDHTKMFLHEMMLRALGIQK